MKTTIWSSLASLVAVGNAFPFIAELASDSLARRDVERRQLVPPPYDGAQQYVSNTGIHAFNPPSGDDQRGPCPGLNAMANHGYFPHNGIGSMSDFIDGCFEAFGMGLDLGAFLAVYGAIFDGNLVEYSIGGPDPEVLNLGGLISEPMGLAGSHNKYEGDVSPIRGDLFVYGNDYLSQVSQFNGLVELAMENGGLVDLPLLTKYRVERFSQSISGNPYFFNAAFAGVIASPAAWTFIYRFMANHTAEHPEGILDIETLKTFYSMTGDYPDFTYTPGYEQFPDNWYRRNDLDAYTIPYFLSDALAMGIEHPQLFSLGGNTGTVNSFVGIEPTNLTGGVYDSKTLLEGNNFFCYALEVSFMEAPDILSGLFTDINPAMDLLGSAINNATNGFICPKLNEIDKSQFSKYPGFANMKPDGTY